MGLDAVGFRGLDQAVEIRAGVDAGDGLAEEIVFPANDERPDRVLGQVVVDPKPTILDLYSQLRPLLVGVVHRFAQRRAWRHDREMLVEPAADVLEQGPRAFLADPLPFLGR